MSLTFRHSKGCIIMDEAEGSIWKSTEKENTEV
jgi:hypothetical protein